MSERRFFSVIAGVFMVVPLTFGASSDESLPDPTKPPMDATQQKNSVSPARQFRLDSILVGDQRRRAVINGTTLAQGGTLANATIVRIGVDRVLIEIGGQQYTLELESAPSIRRE
ncbi:hypothetical protein [Salicola sp. Rm-C-2C1-2]|uniref:hypothetical protein n=1 Tax=Salicola sp. Rm-C-2C1-2 TaxID=3141321 RepID=UPI0032E52C2E